MVSNEPFEGSGTVMPKGKREAMASLDKCPCAGRHLEKFVQPAVLSLLAEEPLHGYLLMQRLGTMPMFKNHAPDSTGVYRFLKAMEDRGLVVSTWDLSESGPAKKKFRLTAKGRKCLETWVVTLEEYCDGISHMLRTLRHALGITAHGKRCGCK
jgi:DNA-binding PadR family transcriptional regulator